MKDSIPEVYLAGSKKIIFTGPNNSTLNMADNIIKDSININTQSLLSSSANITSVTGDASLAEGTYIATISYRDRFSHPAATACVNFTLDTHTETPVITAPASGTANNRFLNLIFTIPESYLQGSAKMVFNQSGITDTIVLVNSLIIGANSFSLDTRHFSASANVLSAQIDTLTNGNYTVSLLYQDALGNPIANTSVSNVNIKNTTTPVVITAPATNTVINGNSNLNLAYTLPEKPGAGTIKLILSNSATTININLSANASGNQTVSVNPKNITASAGVTSSSSNIIGDGVYNAAIVYADTLANPAVTSAGIAVKFIAQTITPTLVLPGSATTNTQNVPVSFNLPVAALANTAVLKLLGSPNITINLATSGSGLQIYTLNGLNLTGSAGVTSASQATIPSGNYTLLLGYQDIFGNDMAYTTQTNVTLTGTTPPVLSTQAITPACGVAGVSLGGGITSATTGLTLTYYTDAGLTNLITDTVHTAGTYYVKATNTYNLNTSAAITVNAFPVTPVVATQAITPACGATSVTLASGIGSSTIGLTINYYSDAGLVTAIGGTVTAAGTYYVKVTNTSGCFASAPIVVNAFSVNPVITTQSVTPACGATSVNLFTGIISNTAGLTLAYYSDAALSLGVSSPVTLAGTYYVKATNTGSCFASAPIVVNAFTVNPAVNTISVTPACGATSVSLALGISGTTAGLTLNYFSDAALTSPISGSVNTAGTYYVKATNTGGCFTSAPIVINAFPVNPAVSTVSVMPACGAISVNLASSISGSTAGLTLSYYSDAALTSPIGGSVNTSGTYYVKATNTGGCFESAPIVVNSFPVNPAVSTVSVMPACGATSVNLASGINGSTAGLTLSYYSDAALTSQISGSVNAAGTYYVKATNTSGCFASAPIVVKAFPVNPVVSTVSVTPACGATSFNLASGISGSTAGLTLSYYSDAGLSNGVNNTVITAGTYYVKTTNSGGCFASAPIVVNPFPVTPIITTQAITPLIGSFNTDLNTGITSSTSGLTVSFYNDAAFNNQVAASVTSPGTYYVKVTNTGGCFTTASLTVNPFTQTIAATNILSPNGDGKNDTWAIKDILLYPKNKVNIYDRAGRLIYSKTGYTNDWDGTSNGLPLAEGTYYYSIELGIGLPSTKGYLTIIKR